MRIKDILRVKKGDLQALRDVESEAQYPCNASLALPSINE